MDARWIELLGALAVGGAVGWVGYALGALTPGAALALALSSGLTGLSGGWAWNAVLLAAVLSAVLWRRYRVKRQPVRARRRVGWLALTAGLAWPVVLAALSRPSEQGERLMVGFAGAVAVYASDSWATELGLLSLQPPRTLISRRRVAAGTPGAMSLLGNVAALTGAWLVGLVTLATRLLQQTLRGAAGWDRNDLWLPLCVALGGVAGSLVDSFLGATAQALYYCEQCGEYCETAQHDCGRRAVPVRGWPWLTNEGVDLASAALGAAVEASLFWGLARSVMPW
ncbi:MAG: DUF92 domain-containing protein [Chloroflexi bacterium]|nr:DUF92 domain-containing protein [Chloroflexota bacterium]